MKNNLSEPAAITGLRCEYKVNPIGIDVDKPRLSWKIQSSGRGVIQTAYQIRAADNAELLATEKQLLWDSGKVASEQSIHVVYAGPELKSRQRVYWQVRIWDNKGYESEWSEAAFWEMGLLHAQDWQAQLIEPNLKEDHTVSNPSPMLRKEFTLNKNIISARAYVTSHGLYQMQLNGQVVGDQLFTPGWTSHHRLQYQTYDITSLLKKGVNCIGVTLGDGWFRGIQTWENRRNCYGETLALLAQIECTYDDDTHEIITTDNTWKACTGPILESDIYNGEIYDARLEKKGWAEPGFDDFNWAGVTVKKHLKDILTAPAGVPVKRIEYIKPIAILKTPNGQTVLDMGQNMVGWLRFSVEGARGTHIKLEYGEVLDGNGNIYRGNLRGAKQTDEYILSGDGHENYEPHFTFHGFRYVAVEGWPGEPSLDFFIGVVIHSEITPTGQFECSDSMINQLQHNIQWSQKGNFIDVPIDCPQRDERMGWTGDAQVFAPTACFNFDVAAFYTKWLADLAADQKTSGAVPWIIPNVLFSQNNNLLASSGWDDAAVIIPWTVYLRYGDTRILQKQYESMKKWVDYMANKAGQSYLYSEFTLGDWLAYSTSHCDYTGATTDKDFINQAFFVRSTDLLQRTAKILGKTDDADKYTLLLAKIKKAFQEEFVTAQGRLASNTQTAYSLALAFDLLPEALRANAAKRLDDDVKRFKHITTGFLGVGLICHILSTYGYSESAYFLLNRKEYPSWLYPITKGATTIWERWDGIKTNGQFQHICMNSFNHYSYGSIGDWLYRVVAGITIEEKRPGYKHVIIQPHPGGGLTYAKARLESMYGPIESNWQFEDKILTLKIEIPPNTTATVKLPSVVLNDVTEGGKPLSKANGIIEMSQQEDAAVIQIGSGKYVFQMKYVLPASFSVDHNSLYLWPYSFE